MFGEMSVTKVLVRDGSCFPIRADGHEEECDTKASCTEFRWLDCELSAFACVESAEVWGSVGGDEDVKEDRVFCGS